MKVAIILGSTRSGRAGEAVANWVAGQIKDGGKWEQVELLDIKQQALPIFEEPELPSMMGGTYRLDTVTQWSRKISGSDAFIFVTPEYNHGLPAPLKNAIDWLYPEWGNKAAAIVSYSSGIGGGIRAAEQLRQVLSHLAVANVQSLVTIPYVASAFGESGAPKEDRLNTLLTGQSIQLYNWAQALQPLRADAKS